ncbi:MAG: hypothetical protein IJR00_04140 [Lachnospiraceae bacterium]|nr:hypothetical protein [Lachnospiraceae bacterium]
MLTDDFMERYKKAWQPQKGCYVLSYYGKEFDAHFPEEKVLLIATAAEKVANELLAMTEDETLTEEILEEFESDVHERHKDSEIHEKSEFSEEETDVIFIVTDGFYNGGPFQKKAFEEATLLVGRANGDDTDSVDWKINLQALFYSTIYTAMHLSLTLSPEEIPEECGWLFFVNVIHYMSNATGGQRYHIRTSEDKVIDSIEEFREALVPYLTADRAWYFEKDQIKIYEKGTRGADEKEKELISSINKALYDAAEDCLVEDTLVISLTLGRNVMYLRFQISGLFEQYQAGGWNTVHKTVSQARDAIYSVNPEKVSELLSTYETAQFHTILRPLNYADNRQSLVGHVYQTVGDIALVLYFLVSDRGGQLFTTKISADQFNSWGLAKEAVMEDALLNNISLAQPRIYTDPRDLERPPVSKGAFMALDSDVKSLPSRGAVVTTTRTTNGAIALFYPGVKEKIAELFQDDFYVVFTAISEAWVHPKGSVTPRTLLARLKESNKAFPDSLLSRKIYLYSRADQTFQPLEL